MKVFREREGYRQYFFEGGKRSDPGEGAAVHGVVLTSVREVSILKIAELFQGTERLPLALLPPSVVSEVLGEQVRVARVLLGSR